MSRLIDADTLIRDIDNSAGLGGALGKVVECVKLYAKFMVQTAPTIEPQRWIPVSERLPDITEHHTSDPCIVFCEHGAYGFAELEENIFGQVGWNCERDDEYHEPLGTVVAWMPLPEPYQSEA